MLVKVQQSGKVDRRQVQTWIDAVGGDRQSVVQVSLEMGFSAHWPSDIAISAHFDEHVPVEHISTDESRRCDGKVDNLCNRCRLARRSFRIDISLRSIFSIHG